MYLLLCIVNKKVQDSQTSPNVSIEVAKRLLEKVVWQGIQRIVFQTNFQPGRGRRRSGWWPFRKRLQCTQNYLKLQNSVPRLNFFSSSMRVALGRRPS